MLAKGAVSWYSRSSNGVEYLGGGVRCLVRGGGAGFRGTVNKDRCSQRIRGQQGAIKLAVNKHASRKTKHIDVEHHLVRDACDTGKVRVVNVRTEDQHADLFTKPLEIQKFNKHAKTVLNVV